MNHMKEIPTRTAIFVCTALLAWCISAGATVLYHERQQHETHASLQQLGYGGNVIQLGCHRCGAARR